jgi:hypothetical protein
VNWRVHVQEALVIAIVIALAILLFIALLNGDELPG